MFRFFMHLQFKIELREKIHENEINSRNIAKTFKNPPNFNIDL